MSDRNHLDRLGALIRDRVSEPVSDTDDAAERARLVERIAMQAPRSRLRSRTVLLAAAAAAVVLAMAGFFLLWSRASSLEASVDGRALSAGAYVSPRDGAASTIRFSDGSEAAVARSSALRVVELSPYGARLLLEEGSATLSITSRERAAWRVEAGGFQVVVTGTRFQVEWSRSEERLHVELYEGSVLVQGPPCPGGMGLRAGQRLVATPTTAHLELIASSASTVAASAPPVALEAPPVEPPVAGEQPQGPAAPPTASWAKRVAAGDHAGVLAEAEAVGIESVLATTSLDNLVALTDAARYAKRGDVARGALLATRRRFAGSNAAKSAAFFLGRMTDDGGSPGAAIVWYDAYLAEAPAGPFTVETLGRKMHAVRRSAGVEAARPLAEDYLRRYPAGPHAHIAREIVGR